MIKSSRTYSEQFFKNINAFRKIVNIPVAESLVIYGGDQDWELEHGKLLSWCNVKDFLGDLD